ARYIVKVLSSPFGGALQNARIPSLTDLVKGHRVYTGSRPRAKMTPVGGVYGDYQIRQADPPSQALNIRRGPPYSGTRPVHVSVLRSGWIAQLRELSDYDRGFRRAEIAQG